MSPTVPAENPEDLFVGIDVGGTNVKLGVVDDQGRVIADTFFPTEQQKGPRYAIEMACSRVHQLLDECGLEYTRVRRLGLGTPGPMDIPAGLILNPSNLPGWRQFPVRQTLSEVADRPVTFANDAAAAAFGEYWVGAGAGFTSLVLFTLGTGVGGGIIVDDVSIDGAHSHGAEIGHVRIDSRAEARVCSCGMLGHLEAYASATAVVARTADYLAAGKESVLADQPSLTPLLIAEAASGGDSLALEVVMETADYLADGIACLAHVIDPGVVLIGGAMNFGGLKTELGRDFLARIKSGVRENTFAMVAENLVIEFAQLGSGAGFVGAAGLARRDFWRSQQGASTGS
ncbi:MAG: ROK family protein [Mariniblastus sp.]|nr:ROK family protein [Mariniblastus sp.]